jgi:histone deacetylase 6
MSHLAVNESEPTNASDSGPTDTTPIFESDSIQTDEPQDGETQASVVVTSSTFSNGYETSASQLPASVEPSQLTQQASDPTADINMAEPDLPTTNGHGSNPEAGPSTANHIMIAGSLFDANGPPVSSEPPPMIYRTGYIWDPLMMLHCPEGYVPTDDLISKGSIHPEEPMRIFRIYRKLAEYGLIPRMRKLDYDEVTQEQVLQVHTQELWDKVLGQECTSIVS